MTLKEAVAITSQHPEARMTLCVNGEGERFAGYVDMVVHGSGDGGFMANKAGVEGHGFMVPWDHVSHWSISLIASGTE